MNATFKNRRELIEEVLIDVKLLKNDSSLNQYAINENIAFFEATKSIFRYIWWLIMRAPKIDGTKLLEINDLLPKWDLMMHRKLMEMEKRKFPGLIEPLVKRIFEIILIANKPMMLMNVGCGGMEAERQVISRLIARKYNERLVFVGMDRSSTTAQLIKENFKDLSDKIELYEVDNLDNQKLQEMIKKQENQFLVLLCKNDIFQLDKYFLENTFDTIFNVLFKHHLNQKEMNDLDDVLSRIGKNIIEYDGYLSWHNVIPQTIVGWSDPVFLSAEIFSHLRFFSKNELLEKNKNAKILFTKIGYYLIDKK